MLKQQPQRDAWSVIGHETIQDYLNQTIEQAQPIPALVLSGRTHLGKTALALRYAAMLVCTAKTSRPCGACVSCRQVSAGTHPDVVHVSPDEETSSISIESIRGLQERLQMRSFGGGHKVTIISDAQKLTLASANALLKTLEEPTTDTTIILTVTHTSQLLPTILSRCQQFELLPVSQPSITHALLERGIERKKATVYAQFANGKPGLALQYAVDNQVYLADQERYQTALAIVGARTLTDQFSLIRKQLSAQSGRVRGLELLEEIMVVVRDVVLTKSALPALVHNTAASAKLTEIAHNSSSGELSLLFTGCNEAVRDIRSNVSPALVLEDLFLNA